jgi:hypothetical protein
LTENQKPPENVDKYNIINVFAGHLLFSLEHMHPEEAFEAAQNATRSYLKSHTFIDLSTKLSEGPPQYKMVAKRPEDRAREARTTPTRLSPPKSSGVKNP